MAESYYQGAYTGAEIDAAIGKVGGIEAGAEVNVQADWNEADNAKDDYIKNKPTLGTAAAKGVDSAPTDASTNLVESGGVYTALLGKIGIGDVFGLGENIPANSDLNSYITSGIYRCTISSTAQTLLHCPTNQGFKLEVRTTAAENRLSQVIYANTTIPEIHCRTYTTNGWSSWYKLDMTVVQAGT